jgi:peptide/nickel transport system substrate-binding protein
VKRNGLLVIGLSVAASMLAVLLIARGSQAAEGKTLTVAMATSLSTVDVQKQGKMDEMAVLINLFDPLIFRKEDGSLEPGLATSWKSLNNKTWQFTLREGVKFHNGEPFNAAAAKFSLDRILDPKTKSPITELKNVDRVEAVDPRTINIITKDIDPMLPDKLTLFAGCMVPPKYIQEKGEEAFASQPVGTGPFTFVEWVKDDHITLQANKQYWRGPVKLDRIVFRSVPDDATRVAALLSGRVDIIAELPPAAAAKVRETKAMRVDAVPGLRLHYLSIAAEDGPLSKAKVRQAISYAIDYKTLIDKALYGFAKPAAAPQAEGVFGYDPSIRAFSFDLAKAKQLLTEAGYPDGLTVDFQSQPGITQDIATAISGMLEKAGIKVNQQVLPRNDFLSKYAAGQLKGLWANTYTIWQGSPEVLIDTFFKTGRPRAKYTSKPMDALIGTVQGTTDQAVRKDALQKILKTLNADAPWAYLGVQDQMYGANQRVKWTPPRNGITQLWDAEIAAQ